jgi:CHAP domain-containing protein
VETLTLTTPEMKGKAVREAQRLLARNKFGKFYTEKVDGIFGEETARACKRAKYWLGYSDAALDPLYGDKLATLLDGTKKLPAEFAARRKARLKADRMKPLREKAYAEAKKHLGVQESPRDSNIVLFSKWYGTNGPWCAMFVTYCYVQAGAKGSFKKGAKWSYCPYILECARAGDNHLAVTRKPKRGDIVLYQFDEDSRADHVGLFERFVDRSGNFTAIEGNTGAASDSNGGEVMRRTRHTSQVLAFVRVGAKA